MIPTDFLTFCMHLLSASFCLFISIIIDSLLPIAKLMCGWLIFPLAWFLTRQNRRSAAHEKRFFLVNFMTVARPYFRDTSRLVTYWPPMDAPYYGLWSTALMTRRHSPQVRRYTVRSLLGETKKSEIRSISKRNPSAKWGATSVLQMVNINYFIMKKVCWPVTGLVERSRSRDLLSYPPQHDYP